MTNQGSNHNSGMEVISAEQKLLYFRGLLKDDVVLDFLLSRVFQETKDRDMLKKLYNSFELDLAVSAIELGNSEMN